MTETNVDEQTREMGIRIARLLEEKQAEDITMMNVRELLPVCDYFIIATGRNAQHLSALSEHIDDRVSSYSDLSYMGQEGEEEGLWVLMDYGSIIIHLFQEHVREYYRLEGLWADAPRVDFRQEE